MSKTIKWMDIVFILATTKTIKEKCPVDISIWQVDSQTHLIILLSK